MFEKYKNIKFNEIPTCAVCGADSLQVIIDLPSLPITGIYVKQAVPERIGFIDQCLNLCDVCGHLQLKNFVDSKIIYGGDYYTRTSLSTSACNANDIFIDFIKKIIEKKKLRSVIEFGCNDQYLLRSLCEQANNLYGIDPILKNSKYDNIHLIGDYIGNCKDTIFDEADLVISSHTVEHLEKPFDVLKELLDKTPADTVFCHQFPGFDDLIANSHFDQVFHQHFNYFSQYSLVCMLDKLGVQIIDLKHNPYHWGAILVAYKKVNNFDNSAFLENAVKYDLELIKESFDIFKKGMLVARRQLNLLRKFKIYGYGAAQMLPLLDYHIGGLNMLECIIDDDLTKNGLFYLNVPLEIRNSERCTDYRESAVIVTAINSLLPLRNIVQRLIQEKIKQIILPINII